MHLFEYTDYRAWLKDQAEELKKAKPFFSYRYIASKLGVNAGLVARIFNGQAHLTLKHVGPTGELFGLSGQEQEYFDELVHFCRAKREKDWERHFARMQSIRGERFKTVADAQLQYYSAWQHNAMRTLLSIFPFKGNNYRRLGSMMVPPIHAEEAKESVELLLSLGLVRKGENGVFEVPDKFISTGDKWKAAMIQAFQKEMVTRSQEAVESVPKSLRDVSTLTIPIARNILEPMRERIREFRQELLAMARDCEIEDAVYQLNIQLFPLALVSGKGEAE